MFTLHMFSFTFSPDNKVKARRGFCDVLVSNLAQAGERSCLSYGTEAMPI